MQMPNVRFLTKRNCLKLLEILENQHVRCWRRYNRADALLLLLDSYQPS